MKQTTIEPYSSIYKKLQTIIPNLEEHIGQGKESGRSQLHSPGMMDLHFDYLRTDEQGRHIIALGHYFKQNGDSVPDPDMEIRIMPEMKMAEAMTFQDQRIYQQVYQYEGDKELVNTHLKKDMNYFLNQWLTNAIAQGHRIDLSKGENEQEIDNSPNSHAARADELVDIRHKNNEVPEKGIER